MHHCSISLLNKSFLLKLSLLKCIRHLDKTWSRYLTLEIEDNLIIKSKSEIWLKFSSKLWYHAKNLEVLELLQNLDLHYYWHQKDDITITSKGYWWTYPGKKLFKNSICVLQELHEQKIDICAGCCSDIIEKYKW